LVVGFGNSGGEIAIDLYEQGARPSIAVRNPVNVVPREVFGIPILSLGLIQRLFSPAVADRITAPLIRALVGDVEAMGLRKLPYGPATQVRTHRRIPLIDIGTINLICRGQISVRPGLDRFDPGHAVFADGTRTRFDAVIAATGYRPRVDFLDANTPAIDREGRPRSSGGETTEPGLFFCGYHVSPNGMLREITVEAKRLAALIARESNRPV
jgi:cation diffusion facilitator CzcD-associated flavoprotein CzcO